MSSKKEIWKPILIDGRKPTVPYMISNFGRFGVQKKDSTGVELRRFKPSGGYYRYNTRQKGNNKAIFLFKEVAKAFLKKPSSAHTFIIHKDHNYLNDKVENLKWATASEHRAHTAQSPNSRKARENRAIHKSSHSKVLNEKSALALKTMIWDPKRKLSLKQIAGKFGVSEMQIYRIKNGEFWYHIRAAHEPLNEKHKQNQRNLERQEKKTKPELKDKPLRQEKEKVQKEKEKKKKKDKSKEHKKKHKKKDKKKKHKKHKHKKH
ncbi:MAG: hypothetical protein JNK73_09195 [Bacteroidia bacterium]|nr:hypothetical protein [Bacteroidia bacterium]